MQNDLLTKTIKNPVVVAVGVILLIMFGYLSIKEMPIALTPNISRPVLSVFTTWPGANLYEVEKEITQRQEKYLKSLPNVVTFSASIREGSSYIALEYNADTDMNKALIELEARLSEVRGYPINADKPVIRSGSDSAPVASYLFIQTNTKEPIRNYHTFISDEIIKYYERIEGVGSLGVIGGVANNIQILVDNNQLAYLGITINQVINSIQAQNINVSAGNLDYTNNNYRVSTIGAYNNLNDILNVIIKMDGTKIIRLSEVAKVIDAYEARNAPNIYNNSEVMTVFIRPNPNANILEVIDKVKKVTQKLNDGILKQKDLYITIGGSTESFIKNAAFTVIKNILIGILLSSLILYIFLRNFLSVIVISAIIPFSVLASFIFLNELDRTLNIVLLAGVSFAISMIIDSSVVVIENIHRHHAMGKKMFVACIDGAREVVAALFASTITTVAIFIPIIRLKDEIGQLFKDIALASSSVLTISFFICIFVIPSFYYVFAKEKIKSNKLDLVFQKIGEKLLNCISKILRFCLKNTLNRLFVTIIFILCSILVTYLFMPKLDYLPAGKRNFLIAVIQAPEGLSYETRKEILDKIHAFNKPYFSLNGFKGNKEYPAIKEFYIWSSGQGFGFFTVSEDPKRVEDLKILVNKSINSIPNIRGVVFEAGVFSIRGLSQDIQINITGFDMDSMLQDAILFTDVLKKYFPGTYIGSNASLVPTNKEINLHPDITSLFMNGISLRNFGDIVDVLVDGKIVGNFRKKGGNVIDIVLKTSESEKSPEDILYSQIYTPNHTIVPIKSLVEAKEEIGLSQIRHFEQNRSILLSINPNDMPLQEALDLINKKVIEEVKSLGGLKDNQIILGANLSKFNKLVNELWLGFIIALVVTYLLLTALYSNFLYPIIIIFTIPFAIAGGFLGLSFVNTFVAQQSFDILTMLGFIILVGSVVNNAILIVYQSLINIKTMNVYDSVYNATLSRIRPIYISMFTTVLALAPLIFLNGDGSEIYRGLGAVISGGILFSTIISIFVIPSILIFVLRKPKTLEE